MEDGALVLIFTFWSSFFTALSVNELFLRPKDPLEERLSEFARADSHTREHVSILERKESQAVNRIKEKLLLAGLKRKSDLDRFLLFQRCCLAAPFLVSIFLYFFLRISFDQVLVLGLLFGVIFMTLPRFWLLHIIFRRRKEITKYFPDTLDLLVVALEAGLSFDSALVRVGEEQRRVSTQVSRELLFTNQQMSVGKPREEALRGLAKRSGVDEIESFVRAVLQSNKLGTSLVKTLRTQADVLRKKRRQFIQAQILKAPVKLIFPLLFFIFPTLLVVILGPSLVQIFSHLKTGGAVS